MSHISTVKVEIRSLSALRDACARLGFQFVDGQRTYKWYGVYTGDTALPAGAQASDLGTCAHAIHVPGANYEVGIIEASGHYELRYDSWRAGGLQQALGDNAERLVQAYAVEAAREEAQRQGYSVWEEAQEDGSIKLHVQVG